jgi:hypothetical protein
MAVHYLTLKQLEEKFGKDLSKKEIKAQRVGSTITVNDEQIVILRDKVTLVKPKVEKELEEPIEEKKPKEKVKAVRKEIKSETSKKPAKKNKPIDNQGVRKWFDYQ